MQIPQLQNMQRPPTMAQPAAAPGFSGMLDNAGTRIGDAIIGANNPFGGAEDVNPDMRRQQIGMALLKMAGDVDSNARRGGSALSGLGEGITNLQQGGMQNAMMKLQGQQLQESIAGSKEERENKKKMRDSLNAMLLGQVGGGAPAADMPGDRPRRIEPGGAELPKQGLSKTKRDQALFWLNVGQPEKAAASIFGGTNPANYTHVTLADGEYMVNSEDPEKRLKIGEAPAKNSTAPSGYRFKEGGQGLEAIPGGPAAPDSDIAKEIAKGIVEGTQPPNTSGLYRYGAQVRAELAKQGFDLSKQQLEFNATNRALLTMNGPQQIRLRQSIGTLSESLPLVRDLATQWKAGKFPSLNKANLILAKEGALGQSAQSLATRLEAEISDVTAELGSVYMGGNSPTDHSLELAAKSLSANWSESTLLDAIGLAETNVRYRRNALNQPVAGIPNNPYDPRGAIPTISPSAPSPTGQDSLNATAPPPGFSQEEWDVLTPEEQGQFH